MSKSASVVSAWRALVTAGAVLIACGFGAEQANAQACIGDCDADGGVAVNELVLGINIASGLQGTEACPAFGSDPGIEDLVTGVGNGLDGCPSCNLVARSSVLLTTQLGDIGPLALRGSAKFHSSSGSERESSCTIETLDPINIVGVGFVCITPATGCPDGVYACDGGVARNVDLLADHNIGYDPEIPDECTGNAECNSECEAYCTALGSTPTLSNRGCEGFCTLDNESCENDLACVERDGGSCIGPDSVPFGNICECQCLDVATGDAGPAGTFSCQLGSKLVVEVTAPCDGEDILIDVGSSCIPLTTQTSTGIIVNANNVEGGELIPQAVAGPGVPLACSTFDSGTVSDLELRGSVVFFGSAIGDILTSLTAQCE